MVGNYYTPKEFGKHFNLSTRTILKAIHAGKVRAFKVGAGTRNPYRIPKSEIDRVEIEGIIEVNPKLRGEETHGY